MTCIDCEMLANGAELENVECPESKKQCGHHCNHVWSHDTCCWCRVEFGEDGKPSWPNRD